MASAPLIDSHCHLEVESYGDELPQVIERARAAGVGQLVAVGASHVARGADEALALSERYAQIYCAVGIHPNEAADATEQDIAHIDACLAAPKAVALGEVGLDYHYGLEHKDTQLRLFARFVQMAARRDVPLMMHVRDAHADCLRVLDEVGVPPKGGVIHCFTAGPEEAEAYLARGLHLSIPGVVTFKSAAPLRAAIPHIPLSRMLVETDCPYLAPVPMRGKRNEPAFVTYTAAAVAALLGVPPAEVALATTQASRGLFGLPPL